MVNSSGRDPAQRGPHTSLAQTNAGGEEVDPPRPSAGKGLSRKPLFQLVHGVLAEQIAKGVREPGAVLPNETDLAREMGVSAGTLRKALDILEADHLVSRRQGRGTFVNDQPLRTLAFRFDNARTANGEWVSATFEDVQVSIGPADDKERSRLQLGGPQKVFRIERLRVLDGSPYMLEHSSMPEALFPELAERASTPYQLADVAVRYGIALARAQERVSALVAGGSVAERLQIPEGTAVLSLDRIAYSSEGTPVELRLAQCYLRDGHYLADMR